MRHIDAIDLLMRSLSLLKGGPRSDIDVERPDDSQIDPEQGDEVCLTLLHVRHLRGSSNSMRYL